MKNLIATILALFISSLIFAQGANSTYSFNGTDDFVEVGAVDFGFTNQITIMGWIKWNIDPKTGEDWANIITNNSENSGDRGQFWIQHDKNNNKLEFALELTDGRRHLWSKTKVEQGVWMHFAATYDGSVQRFYINGIEEAHQNRNANIRAYQSDFVTRIGNWAAYNNGRHFNGDIDEISIWNRALSETEIRERMTRKLNVSDETGLLAYYQFDNFDAGVLIDEANNYNATVANNITALSTAPVGDESVYTYGGDELVLNSDDHIVRLSDFSGKPDGVHIYKVSEAPASLNTVSSDIVEIIDNYYWGVFVVGAKNNTNFRYEKSLTENTNIIINDSLTVASRNNVAGDWDLVDIFQNIADSTVSFYIDGAASHYEFILAKADPSILPIELLSFDVKAENDAVLIQWETASEINNEFFTIQRSADGENWEDIAYIDGAGNSNRVLSYEYMDYSPINGTAYYRLKQTDFDGAYETFNMLAVTIQNNIEIEISVYPNPVVSSLNVRNNQAIALEMQLTNAAGQALKIISIAGNDEQSVEMEHLPSGLYYLIAIDANGNKTSEKILKQ
ncbi:MAG: T9SS type A sorting domain-containing protein [Bacteroidales bacterium]|jgi:hypothetical protein|nr:T9SS type A sorting domain-containing protein [Bacteroidales bacterium]